MHRVCSPGLAALAMHGYALLCMVMRGWIVEVSIVPSPNPPHSTHILAYAAQSHTIPHICAHIHTTCTCMDIYT